MDKKERSERAIYLLDRLQEWIVKEKVTNPELGSLSYFLYIASCIDTNPEDKDIDEWMDSMKKLIQEGRDRIRMQVCVK